MSAIVPNRPMQAAQPMHADYLTGNKRCGAKTRDGDPCKNAAMPNGRCRMHGGKAGPVGPANTSYKGGRYSKYLPPRLKERYEESRRDPNLIALSDEVSLVDSMLTDALEKAQTGETDGAWIELRLAWNARLKAISDGDPVKLGEAMDRLGELITQGAAHADAKAQVLGLVERRRKLSESELKRLVAARQVITVEQSMVLMDKIIILITENVHDRGALSAITAGFGAILHATGFEQAPSRRGGAGQLD